MRGTDEYAAATRALKSFEQHAAAQFEATEEAKKAAGSAKDDHESAELRERLQREEEAHAATRRAAEAGRERAEELQLQAVPTLLLVLLR